MIAGLPIRTVTVELTHRCHRRCAFCYVRHDAGAGRELPARELARRVGELVRDTGCRGVQVSGGEPMLRGDLLDFVDELAARAGGVRVSMITDGGPLDARLAAELVRRRVGPLQPTLLAARAPAHDALRGEGSFEEITRSIALARSARLEVVVSMVVTSRSWADAAGVAELAFALGARGLTLARFCAAGAAAGAHEALTPGPAQVAAAVTDAARACRALGLKLTAAITIPACVFADRERPPVPLGVCSLVGPHATVTVGPDGAVRSCAMSERSAGVLGETPWRDLASALWAQELRPLREAVPPACRACPAYPRCLGGCRLAALAVGGRPDALDPLAVASQRRGGLQ